MKRRVLARGLILQADASSAETTYLGQRFELRDLTLDVEVPGQAPYEARVTARVPRIVEALPGAALDLSVDPSSPNDIEILGPAGASDWIRAAAAVPGQTWCATQPVLPAGVAPAPFQSPVAGLGPLPLATPGPRSGRTGCGILVAVLVGLALALVAALSMLNRRHESRPTPAHTTPSPPGHRSRPGHPH